MGCDVHFNVEMQSEGGSWHRAEDLVANPYYTPSATGWDGQTTMRDSWYDGRNYSLFSKLAGVRDRDGFTPVIEPRGLPADVCPETKDAYDEWGVDAHTAHWYSLRELANNIDEFTDPEMGCPDFVQAVNRMMELCNDELEGDGERMRIVVWFDN